jgi:hypothetical protein
MKIQYYCSVQHLEAGFFFENLLIRTKTRLFGIEIITITCIIKHSVA